MSTDLSTAAIAEALAARLAKARTKAPKRAAIPGRPAGADVVLSSAQRRLWFLHQLAPDSAAYTLPVAWRLRGPVDSERLRKALVAVVESADALRTFYPANDGTPTAVLAEAAALDWREFEGTQGFGDEVRRPFDLGVAPPFRASLFRVGPDEHVLLLCVHHIAADGWSVGLIADRLSTAYGGGGLAVGTQYADVAHWQQQRSTDCDLAYWREQLADSPRPVQLPGDRPRPAHPSDAGGEYSFQLDEAATSALRALAANQQVSTFMCLVGAFQLLCGRQAGVDDITVATPVGGRDAVPELRTVIGCLIETVLLRARIEDSQTGRELLQQVRNMVLEATEHAAAPFEEVAALLPYPAEGRPPYSVLFSATHVPRVDLDLPGLQVEPVPIDAPATKVDLTLEVADLGGPTMSASITYSTELFQPATIERFAHQYLLLLQGLTADIDAPVATLPLLTPAERSRLLAPPAATSPAPLILTGFADTVRRAPDRVAVTAADGELTYAELDALSSSLALRLLAEGAGRESVVGLSAARHTRYAVGLLGILKAGAAYVPIEPTHPPSRQTALLSSAGARLAVNLGGLPGITPLDALSNDVSPGPLPEVAAGDLAYVIFTSGSTGRPKGIAVEHGGLAAYVDAFTERLHPEDGATYAVVSTLAADLGHSMVFTALSRGGTLQLVDAELAVDSVALSKQLAQHPVDYLKIVPSHLAALIGSGNCLPRKGLVLGGAASPWSLIDSIRRQAPELRILNHYGPTETTVGVLAYEIPTEGSRPTSVPLGTPLSHAAVHILDRQGEPQPVGVWGELCVRGPAVARGYLGEASGFGGRYATGDRARWLPDGTVEFGGRLDRQTKIRGHRVEPGEIEAVLATHPAVDAAAVLVAEGSLHGYVGSTREPGDLRKWLAERLPDHLVPTTITVLPELPLNPNGKVDLAALTVPDKNAEPADRPLTGRTQQRIAAVFADLLDIPTPAPDADFFDLGGHSLLAIRAAARLRRDCGVAIVVRDLFEHRTIVALANHIDGLRRSDGPELVHRKRRSTELSHGQQRYWFLDQVDPGNPVNNLPSAFRLTGDLDHDALRAALAAVVERHEILRTAYPSVGGEPRAVVRDELDIPLPVSDLRGRTAAAIRQRIDDEFRHGFDLAAGPPLRAALLRTGEAEHLLLLTVHHIASDGWSNAVLLEDLSAAYRGESFDPLPVTYSDYTQWETEKTYHATQEFWRSELEDAPSSLDLPLDHPRPALPTHRGGAIWLDLDADLTAKLSELSRSNDVTLFMTLLAAYQVVLARYAGVEDVVVGTAVAGRDHPDLNRVVGMFVNSLPLRAKPERNLSFLTYLQHVRRTVLDGFEHSAMPFDRLLTTLDVPRDPSRTPVFTTMFVLQNTPPAALELPGLTVEPIDAATGVARTDLSLYLTEDNGGLRGALEYNSDILDRSTAERLTGYLRTLLITVAASPESKLGDLPLSDTAEREQLLNEWNATTRPLPSGLTPDWVVRQAAQRPQSIAVRDDRESLTYAELDSRSAALAQRLADLGAGKGTVVGLALERSIRMPVAILAVLRLGATYLPLDPEYPADRLSFMVEDSGAAVLITDGFAQTFGLPSVLPSVDLREPLPPATAPNKAVAGSDPAYIIYTSGSTGRPKGVVVPHSALANLLSSFAGEPGLTAEDTVLSVASMSFDMSVKELLLPLTVGATLVIGGPKLAADGEALAQRIRDTGTTYLQATPLSWQLLLETGWTGDPHLTAVCGGEALPPDLAVRLQGVVGELWNLYGPTETTVWSTREHITSAEVTVGRPISNTCVYVLDDRLRPVPLGAVGELCIGGAGVALGYHGKPELTAERFVPNPFGDGRIYRTGDLARWRSDGRLEVRGRADGQVKLRGYRIEVGEIETVLTGHPEIVSAAVTVRQDRLVAYVVGLADGTTDAELREFLRGTLPDYMLPATFVRLPGLPTTPNGKIDRLSLPAPATPSTRAHQDATPEQAAILKVFGEVLGCEVGVDDGFFDVGGDSLRAVRAVRAIDPELSVLDLFRCPSARSLADYLQTRTRAAAEVLQQMTKLGAAEAELTVVGAPFGGGGAIVYADLAQRMPDNWALYAVQPPGTDYSRPDEALIPLPELADRCAERILAEVPGKVMLYGHCVGSALAVAIAQRLERAGKIPESVVLGASFPNTRLPGVLGSIARLAPGRRQSDRMLTDTLRVLGGLGEEPPPDERAFVAKAIRHQADQGELYFTNSFTDDVPKLRSPLRVVVGDLDEATRFSSERVHDWDRFGEVVELVGLPGAGHFFHRDPRVAELLTRPPSGTVSQRTQQANLPGFLTVTAGQFVSLIGAGLSTFALGVWAYQQTGRATALATIAAFAIVPVILTAPLAGAVADRWNRRRVMMGCDLTAVAAAAMLIVLLAVDSLALWHLYVFVTVVAVTSSFRQPAYLAAVAQLVPKRYLGQANGLVGLGTAAALLFSQLLGGVLLLALSLSGVLWIDLATSVVALATLAVVKVPDLGFHVRDEPWLAEIAGGWRYLDERRGLLAVAAFFAVANGLGGVVVVVTTPMVLAFGSTATLGLVLAAQGAGLLLGGVLMAIWGGTSQRVTGMIAGVGLIGLSSVVIGLHPSAFFPIAGMFGVGFCAALINAHWLALVQVKVPHELLGRVLATILMLARVVMPLGYLAAGPLVDKVFEPPMRGGGVLARVLGPVFGTGTGRGMAVVVAATGVLLVAWSLVGLASRSLRKVEQQLPDAVED
ncbi:amino acid adenylation domain-containing protein [Kribbella voronezhensis]|uniref:Amino acid adenylation domain-containing protein n=1 Tax=Kribbella voronezhensis TaxID=2512212 RepID=A0A4R7TIC9_9ACTN|nr:non-ribosomal peptide synthetase/MFS transporter [Kribbella voronezhensis]TDU91247.1 amino acid adenylation domain-containing protein [Kribbella voronezhensis]